MNYKILLDKMIAHFTSASYMEELILAKRQFFGHLLPSDEDAYQFNIKMAQFMDWYIFDYYIQQTGLTPIEETIELKEIQLKLQINTDDIHVLKDLLDHRHSLFEIIQVNKKGTLIRDLITTQKIQIDDSSWFFHLKKGEYFEARIVPIGKTYRIFNGICIHPVEARGFILKEIKNVKQSGKYEQKEFIRKLARMCFKFHQFPHIKIEYIYTNDSHTKL